jgi:general secretion pathway protein G
MTPQPHSSGGFSLIELLVTLAIVAVLGVMIVPVVQVAQQREKEQLLLVALREIRGGIDAYKRAGEEGLIEIAPDVSGYPPNLDLLVEGVPRRETQSTPLKGKPGPAKALGGKIYFLRRLPRDPMNDQVGLTPSQTWGKRSFSSESSDPKEGDDVYDVYSLSPKRGLNGSLYAAW